MWKASCEANPYVRTGTPYLYSGVAKTPLNLAPSTSRSLQLKRRTYDKFMSRNIKCRYCKHKSAIRGLQGQMDEARFLLKVYQFYKQIKYSPCEPQFTHVCLLLLKYTLTTRSGTKLILFKLRIASQAISHIITGAMGTNLTIIPLLVLWWDSFTPMLRTRNPLCCDKPLHRL